MSDLKPKSVKLKVSMETPHEPSKGLLLICYFMLINVLLYIKKLNEQITNLQSEVTTITNQLNKTFCSIKEIPQTTKNCDCAKDEISVPVNLTDNNQSKLKKYDLIIYGNSLSTLIYFSAKKFQELITSSTDDHKVAWIGKFSPHTITYNLGNTHYCLPLSLDLYPNTVIVPELMSDEIAKLAEHFSISTEKIQQIWQKLLVQALEIPTSADMDIIIDNSLDILEKLTLEKKKNYQLALPKKALKTILETSLKHIDHYPYQEIQYQDKGIIVVNAGSNILETESLVITEEPIIPGLGNVNFEFDRNLPYVINDKYESSPYLNYYYLPTERNYILAYHNGLQLKIWSNSQQLLRKIEGNNSTEILQENIKLNDTLVLPSVSIKSTDNISFTGASYLPASMSNIRDLLILYELMIE